MDLGMTIRATIDKELLDTGCGIQGMACMTLQTKKRHCCVEKVAVDGTVGRMTVGTVFRDICMLEDERPLFIHMAPGTGLLGGCTSEEFILDGAVRVMAIITCHFLFHHGMMGEKPIFRFYLGVTTVTKLRHLVAAHLLLRSLVELVTIEAAHVI